MKELIIATYILVCLWAVSWIAHVWMYEIDWTRLLHHLETL